MYGGVDCKDIFINDDVDALGKLLSLGVVTVDSLWNYWTPLMSAAYRRSIRCLNLLIKHGSKLDYLDNLGRSALYLAVKQWNVACVQSLIQAGVDVNLTGNEFTPLAAALEERTCRNHDIITILIFAGANLNKVRQRVFIPPWVLDLRDKIEQHRSTTLSLYGGYLEGKTQKKVVPPKDIILIICRMMWNKRKT